jgi:hypothetical protein
VINDNNTVDAEEFVNVENKTAARDLGLPYALDPYRVVLSYTLGLIAE